MSTPFGSYPFDAAGVDNFSHPEFINWNRAPTSLDIYPAGTQIQDNSVSPPIIYQTTGYGNWDTGGVEPATTTRYGTVILTDNSEPVATKVYADNLAIAGAPVSTTTVAGIGQLATDGEAVAGTASTPALALFVTPSNLAPVFAAPPAIGGTTPAAATFTTLDAAAVTFSGLLTAQASAVIDTAGTALDLATDADTAAVNIGTGAAARTITVGNVTGATAVNVNTGTGGFAVATTGSGDIVLNSDDTVLIDADGVLELNSSAGAINIGNDADAQAINIGTGAAARTVTIGNGTGATSIVVDCGTGNLNIGANAVAHTVTIGNSTGATSVVIDCGTGALNIGANAVAHTVTIGNVTGATAVNINAGSGGSAITTTNSTLALQSGTGAINIGTAAAANTITIGNSTGASAVSINAGTGALNVGTNAVAHTVTVGSTTGAASTVVQCGIGALTLVGGGDCTVDSAGLMEINSSGGVISIGNDAVAQNINVGTGAAARTITIGNVTGATAVNVNSGTGACAWTTTNGAFSLVTGTGAINVGADAAAKTITIGNGTGATSVVISCGTGAMNIGSNAVAHTVTLGSTTGAAATVVQGGTGGIALNASGLVTVDVAEDTQASPTATSTLNVNVGAATFTGFTTASAASQVFTITNSLITTSSDVIVTACNEGANDAQMTVMRVKRLAGSMEVTLKNNGAAALNGNVTISFWVLEA